MGRLGMLSRNIMLYIYIIALVIGFMGTANAYTISELVDWDYQIKISRTPSMAFDRNGPIEIIHDDIILDEGISITEPATMLLVGVGLAAIARYRKRYFKRM